MQGKRRHMHAFLGIAILVFGVSGSVAAAAQSLASVLVDQAGQSVGETIVRAKKGDRLAVPRPEDEPAPLLAATMVVDDAEVDASAPIDEVPQTDLASATEPHGSRIGASHSDG